jgi:hypothetical protein
MSAELSDDALDAAIALIGRAAPEIGSVWRHRKGGAYVIVCSAVREADLVPVVVYRDEYPQGRLFDKKLTICWTRPLAEFADGRFTLVRPAGVRADGGRGHG